MLGIQLVSSIAALLVCIYAYFKWRYSYWAKKNVPFVKPTIPFGTFENVFRHTKSMGEQLKGQYNELKARGCDYGGLYNFAMPIYFPIGLDQVKDVMQTNFQHFSDRGVYYNEEDDPLSAHLFAVGGQKWRNLRTKLTPTFTSGKMKSMFETLVECSHPLEDAIKDKVKRNEPVDIKEAVARFTTDVIGSCAFGLDCNSFKSPNAEFRKCGKMIFEPNLYRIACNTLFMTRPRLGQALGVKAFPTVATDFFMKTVRDTVDYRQTNNIHRNDMLNILIELSKSSSGESKHDGINITFEELAAQAFVFFLAGFETSSTTMSFCLYELASNPDIQDKVREEIVQVLAKNEGKITYEVIGSLKYMSQVVDETLRKYPPLPQLTRQCVKDYKLPDQDVVIEKGTGVFISVLGLHHDPDYFPDPEKFDPERFSDENKNQIPHFSYIPFGEGPRNCIGLRFGYMQTKVGLTVLLKNFQFSLNAKTKVPLEIDSNRIIYSTIGTIWLNAKKL